MLVLRMPCCCRTENTDHPGGAWGHPGLSRGVGIVCVVLVIEVCVRRGHCLLLAPNPELHVGSYVVGLCQNLLYCLTLGHHVEMGMELGVSVLLGLSTPLWKLADLSPV